MNARAGAADTPQIAGSVYTRGESIALLAAIMAVTVTLSLVVAPLGQVADPVRKSLGIDDVQFSYLLGTLFAIPSMIMTVAGGWLADRISRRTLLATAMVAWTGGAVWSALAGSYYELAAARLIIAAAAGIKFPLVMTWVTDAYPPQRRGRAIGAVFVFIGIGPAIGGALSGVVLQAAQQGVFQGLPVLGSLEPWRIALILLASTNALVVPWVLALPDKRTASWDEELGAQAGVHHEHSFWLLSVVVLSTAMLTLADNANLSWLPTILSRQHHLSAQEVGFAFALVVFVAGTVGPTLGGWLDGWIYERRGSTGRMLTCAVATLACAPLLASFVTGPTKVYLTALVGNGVLTMLATTVGFVVLQSLLPPNHRGIGIGIGQATNNLAAASAPTIVALMGASAPDSSTALGHGMSAVTFAAYCAASLCWVVSAVMLRRSSGTASSRVVPAAT